MFNSDIVLITGGTGSFGNAVLDRLLNTDIKEIRILSRDEKKQNDMRLKYSDDRIKFIIGDVRDFNSVYYAAKNVDYVFHAAALKQVPTCEFYPIEAIKTNILGSHNVINAAVENNVRKVIFLSTDKAAYPINAMGMSKALMEKLAISMSREMSNTQTVFCCTRYGNVMCSRGSVIPLFVDQIKSGKAITITDPNMTRFLMSLDEAVELVINAFNGGVQGDIWVQKAPASTIYDLAIALKELFKSDIEINIIGVRQGEKKHETLVTKEEMLKTEDRGKYYRIKRDYVGLSSSNQNENNINLLSDIDFTSENAVRLNVAEIKEKLLKLDYIKKELGSFKKV
jgi:UDP-N-acetylglucosamine 4,6-dehydratase/5-epimerase